MLAKGVLDGLQRVAGVAAKEVVREDLSDPRPRPGSTAVPVLIDERADTGRDTLAAREHNGVLDVPQRPKHQDIFGPVDPAGFRNRGAPSCDPALDGRTTPALQPLRRILAVRLDEGVGYGMDEVVVRGHFALRCEALLGVASIDSAPSPFEVPSLRPPRFRLTTRRPYAARCATRTFRSRRCSGEQDERFGKAGQTYETVVTTDRRTCGDSAAKGRVVSGQAGYATILSAAATQAVPSVSRR